MSTPEILQGRTFGIDLSKYQVAWHGIPEDAPYRMDFVTQRLSYGGRSDERRKELYTQILEHGPAARMAYHYASTALSWKAQADMFLGYYLEGDYHAVWWDFEGLFNNLNTKFATDSIKAIRYIRQDLRDRGRPDPVGLYLNISLFKQFFTDRIEEIKDIPIWMAQYWYQYSVHKDPGLNGTGLSKNELPFWQYTADRVQMRTVWKPWVDRFGHAYGFESDFLDGNLYLLGNREHMAANFLNRPGLFSEQPPADPPVEPEEPPVREVFPDVMSAANEAGTKSATYVKVK